MKALLDKTFSFHILQNSSLELIKHSYEMCRAHTSVHVLFQCEVHDPCSPQEYPDCYKQGEFLVCLESGKWLSGCVSLPPDATLFPFKKIQFIATSTINAKPYSTLHFTLPKVLKEIYIRENGMQTTTQLQVAQESGTQPL